MELICDSRELKIIHLLEKYKIIKEQLTVGDFAIKFNGEIKFVFERKTWKDFAASIRDGRLESQSKNLLSLGCSIYIIFEGAAFYSDETVIGGMEFKKLDAMRRKLMMIGIPHIQTKNLQGTADFLINFSEQYSLTKEKTAGIQVDKIKERKCKTLDEIHETVWLSISGVGKSLLDQFKQFKLADLFTKSISPQILSELKYNTSNRKLGIKCAEKILKLEKPEKILSSIHGVSLKSAAYILKSNNLASLAGMQELELGKIMKSEKKIVGAKLARLLYLVFNKHN